MGLLEEADRMAEDCTTQAETIRALVARVRDAERERDEAERKSRALRTELDDARTQLMRRGSHYDDTLRAAVADLAQRLADAARAT